MEIFWWLVTISLFAVGLIGTVVPILPGTTVILAAAIMHRLMLSADKSIGWRTIAILTLLTFISYAFDFLGSYFGAKFFGATRWGAFGAILGAVIGLFFGIIGLFVGPVIGAITGEFIAGKRMIDAGRAGWGSFIGNLGAMIGRLLIALAMISIFLGALVVAGAFTLLPGRIMHQVVFGVPVGAAGAAGHDPLPR